MKNVLALMALAVVVAGSFGCSSTPKKEEAAQEPAVAATEAPAPVVEPAKDLSLGAGSSGRGH